MNQAISNEIIRLFRNGETPSLVFDKDQMLSNLKILKNYAKKDDIRILLAVKSLPHKEVLSLLVNDLDGFDVSNLNESGLLPPGSFHKTLFLTNPSLSPVDIREFAKSSNAVLTADNPYQLKMLAEIETPIKFVLRVNTGMVLGEETPSRFGFDPGELGNCLDDLRRIVRRHSFLGFHLHHGSEKNSSQDYFRMAEAALALSRQLNVSVKLINLGGGLHNIGYDQLPGFFSRLRSLIAPEIKVFFEPGRLLGHGAGYGIARITTFKKIKALEYYTLDLSRVCHLGWSSPQLFSERQGSGKTAICRLFGPTCYEGDYLGEYIIPEGPSFPTLSLERPVIFVNISTYSMALNRSFNGIPGANISCI